MDNTSIASLLTNLLCLLPFCLSVLGLIAVGALLLWVIRRQRRRPSAETLATEKDALRSEVASQMAALRPWRWDALADLRTFRKLRWSSFGRDFRMRGLVAASRSDRERTWAAFALRGRRLYRGPLPFHGLASPGCLS